MNSTEALAHGTVVVKDVEVCAVKGALSCSCASQLAGFCGSSRFPVCSAEPGVQLMVLIFCFTFKEQSGVFVCGCCSTN